MHTQIEKEQFLNALDIVVRTSTKHQTLPVLQCVLLEAKQKTTTLKTTNLELGIEVTIPTKTEKEGVVAVPATTLQQTIALLSDTTITLKQTKNILLVEAKKAKTSIKTLPHNEFPGIPTLDSKKQTINAELLALVIKTAAFAVSQSSIKPELGSVYIHQEKPHTLTCVATDSFRLVEKVISQKGLSFENPILIPHKNAAEIARLLEVLGGEPTLLIGENQCGLIFETEKMKVYVTSRLTDGTFPDYKQIIPKEYTTHTTLLRADLLHALKKTNVFTNKFLQVGMTVDPKKQNIVLSSDNSEVGTTEEIIAADTDGEKLSLNFNQRYISEPLQHFVDDSLILHFAGVGRPLVIEGVNEKSLRYLVMPMNR